MANGSAERILDAAAKLFLQYGFKRTTMEDIASAVGISKASLYLHFQNKDAIFHAVSDRQAQRVLAGMKEIRDGPLEPEPKLCKLMLSTILGIWDFCHQGPHAPDVWADTMPIISEHIEPARRLGQEIIADVIAQGQSQKVFRTDIDARKAAWLVQLASRGFNLPFLGIHSRDEVELRLPELVNLLIHGLRCNGQDTAI